MKAVLAEAGMSTNDLVKLTVLCAAGTQDAITAYREGRDQRLQGHAPAALFAILSAFTHPDILVEVEAVAAK